MVEVSQPCSPVPNDPSQALVEFVLTLLKLNISCLVFTIDLINSFWPLAQDVRCPELAHLYLLPRLICFKLQPKSSHVNCWSELFILLFGPRQAIVIIAPTQVITTFTLGWLIYTFDPRWPILNFNIRHVSTFGDVNGFDLWLVSTRLALWLDSLISTFDLVDSIRPLIWSKIN